MNYKGKDFNMEEYKKHLKGRMMAIVVLSIILVFGIAQMDVVFTAVVSRTGIPHGIEGHSFLLQVSNPQQIYHAGIMFILFSYVIMVTFVVDEMIE